MLEIVRLCQRVCVCCCCTVCVGVYSVGMRVGESRAHVKSIRNWPSKCKASAKSNKTRNKGCLWHTEEFILFLDLQCISRNCSYTRYI